MKKVESGDISSQELDRAELRVDSDRVDAAGVGEEGEVFLSTGQRVRVHVVVSKD